MLRPKDIDPNYRSLEDKIPFYINVVTVLVALMNAFLPAILYWHLWTLDVPMTLISDAVLVSILVLWHSRLKRKFKGGERKSV